MDSRAFFRRLLASALAPVWLILLATAAGAHAAIVSSIPAAGEELKSAPEVVSLTFSEPLTADLSRMVVRSERPTAGGTPQRRAEDADQTNYQRARRLSGGNGKTVSPVDGHSLEIPSEIGPGDVSLFRG